MYLNLRPRIILFNDSEAAYMNVFDKRSMSEEILKQVERDKLAHLRFQDDDEGRI